MNQRKILKVLITDEVHPYLVDSLTDLGYEIYYEPEVTWEAAFERIPSFSGVVINTKMKMNASMLNRASNLHFIARLGSGLDIIDLPLCSDKGIHVINSPEGNRNAVAEHNLGMILMLLNKLKSADKNVRNGQWDRELHRGLELSGRTVGIIGYGHNGANFAKLLKGFDVNIIVYDKFKSGFSNGQDHIKEVSFETLIQHADLISLHVPLTAETHYMIDHEVLSKCRKNCILINSSRGNVVHLASLVNSLENGAIKGACLDVLENEKPWTYTEEEKKLYKRLYKLENVILSPHVAGWTVESKYKIAKTLVDKIKKISDLQ